ncbi:MAG TPA: copper-binding protein [Pyrinomonadaceae bacterium]
MLNSKPPGTGGGLRALLLASLALSASCGREPQAGRPAEPTPQAGAAAASPVPWGTIEPPAQVGPAAAPGAPQARRTPSAARSYAGVGVVRLVNLKEGWLEIDHEEIEGLMPAMQMEWSVRDRALLKSVRAGDKVDFTVEDDNGTEVITALKKAPAPR